MSILLSIQQIYVHRIFEGTKQVEYRTRFWSGDGGWVYIYAGRPVKKIVGRFRDGGIIRGDKFRVWAATQSEAGITALDYFDYFAGSHTAGACIISDLERFHVPVDPYKTWPGFRAVQSWRYLTDSEEEEIMRNQRVAEPLRIL